MSTQDESSNDYQDNDSDNNSGSENAAGNGSDSASNSSQHSGSDSHSDCSDNNASSSSGSEDEREKSEAEKSDEDNGEEKSEEERSEEERSDEEEKSEAEQSDGEQSGSEQSDGDKDAASNSPGDNSEECPSRMTQVNFDESDTQDSRASRSAPRLHKKKDASPQWDMHPELYGIRRSGRQRKEPARLQAGLSSGSEDDQPKRRRRRQRTESDDWNMGKSQSDDESEDDYKPSKRVVRAARQSRPTRAPQKKGGRAAASKSKSKSSHRRRKHSSSESDHDYSSDDDVRGRHHSRRQTTAKVRSKSRSSKRKGTKRVSYKEVSENDQTDSEDLIEQNYDYDVKDEEELNRETIERILEHRYGKKGDIGNGTALYNRPRGSEDTAEDKSASSPKAEEKDEKGEEELEVQYFIKWKNWAYIHNTWETEASLKQLKAQGMRKLEKYKQAEAEYQARLASVSRDEIEMEMVHREMEDTLVKSYFEADRVIAKMAPKTEGGEPDLLVKWCALPYSEATWEDMNLIKTRFPEQVEAFNYRQSATTIPAKSGRAVKIRPKFVPFKTQPEYLGKDAKLELRDYQLDGLNWLLASWTKHNSVILADEMGLGKTIQIISFLSVLMNGYQVYGPFLVVVPLSTVPAWDREFKRWAPLMNVIIYVGDIKSRSVIRDCEWYKYGTKSIKFNVVVTTYEILLKDKSFLGGVEWQVLGVDEAHRLKNDDSLLYKSLKDFKTHHRILITGTPLQNSLKELWSLMHFIMPEKFDIWEDFQDRHEQVDEHGNKLYRGIHKELEQFLIRRVKKDVEKSLPAKVEQILRVEMSSMQRHIYKLIVTKNFKALSKGTKGPISSFLNIMMELKKCCNHILLIKEPENTNEDKLHGLLRGSGKLLLLDKLLCRLRDNHRVLIFSQMVRMLDILAEYLTLRGFPFQRLDGSVRNEVRKQALDHFNAEGSQDFCFLLSTRAGGLGINLATADTVIIFDSDWNPQNDLQAQARAHRIGQQKQVSVYRLVTKNSVEEDIVERAKKKMVLDHLVIQRMDTTGRTTLNKAAPSSSNPFNKEELASILKFGAEQLFKVEDDEDPQVDIDEVLKMAETHNTDAATPGSELLSNFKVVSFDNMEEDELMDANTNQGDDDNDENEPSWDDIIPADFRAKVEAEQTEEELKKMYLGPRKRKTVMNGGYDSNNDRHRKKDDQEGDDDEDYEEGSNADDGEDRPKKRGRPRTRDKIKGFTDAEIRRFIKSFKKFAAPLTRLDAIACDAELQEKSEADLKRLGEMLFNECTKAMDEYRTKLKEDPTYEEKKTHRGPTVKLSNVMINAQSVTKANSDLEPLIKELPADEAARNRYQLQCRVKAVHWDKPWDVEDDSNLLKGVYMYGMGSWENIKMDPSLKLSDKILPDEMNSKPQGKHLQTRVEYLLKVLGKQHETGAPAPVSPTPSKSTGRGRRRKPKSKAEVIEKDDFSSDDNTTRDETMDSVDATSLVKREVQPSNGNLSLTEGESLHGPPEAGKPKETEKKKKKKKKTHGEEQKSKSEEKEEPEETDKSEKKKHKEKEHSSEKKSKPSKKKQKKDDGPLHFTASAEPHSVTHDELPPDVYLWCKDSMKPMRKQLKKMMNISNLPKKEAADNEMYKNLLLKIGRHISTLLSEITDVTEIQQKRGWLWSFCTIFQPGMKARKLHTLYKKYLERQQDETRTSMVTSEASQSSMSSFSQPRPDFSKKRPHPPDRPGDSKERPVKKHKSNHEKSHDGSSPSKHQHGSRPKGSSSSRDSSGQKHSGASKRPWGQIHRPDPSTSTSSPSVTTAGWTQASPLARAEDQTKSRYSSAGAYSGWHDPHRNQSHGADHKSDGYHRYNSDRPGGSGHHYGRDHSRGVGGGSGFHGENRGGSDHHRGNDHRGDHHRSSGYGGHYSHSSYHSRPGEDRGSGGYHSHRHGERKRWSDDHGDSSERRAFKDPRMEPRIEPPPRMDHRSPLSTEHRSPFMPDPRTTVVPPVAGAAGHH